MSSCSLCPHMGFKAAGWVLRLLDVHRGGQKSSGILGLIAKASWCRCQLKSRLMPELMPVQMLQCCRLPVEHCPQSHPLPVLLREGYLHLNNSRASRNTPKCKQGLCQQWRIHHGLQGCAGG